MKIVKKNNRSLALKKSKKIKKIGLNNLKNNATKKKVTFGARRTRSSSTKAVKISRVTCAKKVRRKNYSEDAVKRAVEAVSQGVSLRKAEDTYGVPYATISRKFKNPGSSTPGPKPFFTPEEEQEIANWIFYRAERGMPVTKDQLLDSVQIYIQELGKKNPFIDDKPKRHWYEGFLRRNKDVALKTPQQLSLQRANVDEDDIRAWFAEQRTYLSSKNLLEIDGKRVYNCDETNIQLCPKSKKVLARKGESRLHNIVDGNEKEHSQFFSCLLLMVLELLLWFCTHIKMEFQNI